MGLSVITRTAIITSDHQADDDDGDDDGDDGDDDDGDDGVVCDQQDGDHHL